MTVRPQWPASRCDWTWLGLIWASAALLLVLLMRGQIASLHFRDPDDALRLVQVRAWIEGQSWFDVTQYRVNPPVGGPMHWWRLLDVPIASGIVALTPLVGRPSAEVITLTVYPLLLLGLFFFTVGRMGARLGGGMMAIMAAGYAATQFFTINQFAPLRIDHHGWQLILAVMLTGLFLQAPSPRRMLLSGCLLAAYLCISLEALPYALMFGAIPAVAYIRSAEGFKPLALFLAASGAASILWTLATRGTGPFLHPACDALTQPYLAALSISALTFPLLHLLLPGGLAWRIGALALTGGVALITLLISAPECAGGPFSQLDPLVYDLWYLKIPEGRPVLEQDITIILAALLPSLFALIGGLIAWRTATLETQRHRWAIMLWLTLGSMLVTLSVSRGMYIASAIAAPGGAWLLLHAFRHARTVSHVALRIIATASTILLVPIIPAGLIGSIAARSDAAQETTAEADKTGCRDPSSLDILKRLPKNVLFAPIDLGPTILSHTQHSVFVTGHHRNDQQLHRTIMAFTGSLQQAREAMSASPAAYLVYCPDENEMELYRKYQPSGLLSQLENGDIPPWLTLVYVPEGSGYRIYRIQR